MSLNNLLASSSESLHRGALIDNVYYDGSNLMKSQYKVERDAKNKFPLSSLNFGTEQIVISIPNNHLMSHIVGSLTFPAGTLYPLPALKAIKKVTYQLGNSNDEELNMENILLSQMSQFDTHELRQYYLDQLGGAGGVIATATTYNVVINLPWSKMTRKKKLPIDTKLLSGNIIIKIDLASADAVYSSASPPSALTKAYLQPVFYKWINPNDSLKLIGVDMSTGNQISHIYAYPCHYEKGFKIANMSNGDNVVDIKNFLPGMIDSITFCVLTTFPNTNRLSNIKITYNADDLSVYGENIYEQMNIVEKNNVDQYTVNSVVSYFYEIPFSQFNFYNNMDSDYHYSSAFNTQTLQLAFTTSATGTLVYNINYKKMLVFDGVTANIL
jgi:hypothetical protein